MRAAACFNVSLLAKPTYSRRGTWADLIVIGRYRQFEQREKLIIQGGPQLQPPSGALQLSCYLTHFT
jgi:hypothetical protein